jgi:hypothetical protein
MYQPKKYLEKRNLPTLKRQLRDFLKSHSFIKCRALNHRKVFFEQTTQSDYPKKKRQE